MVKLERCWPWLERRGLQSGDRVGLVMNDLRGGTL
jgi:hypothetical protein